ncbi:MAG TPA: TIGR03557 family F420-dependent LLM class oxidoreductase [Micromonosporaceae bacterium]|jgi:G6PDH family F420-dependent oxidoreductase
MELGYFLSCEEYGPGELVEQARLAADAGFTGLWISDHFHPWLDTQGESPFVWSVIGAISQVCDLPIMTAVTCPTTRIHPVIVAQAAATSAVLTGGRFTLGVGTGEALNEHVTGAAWPGAPVRREMLTEAVEVMRKLWTGEVVNHHGRYYTVEHARLYTCPEQPIPVYVSGFGPESIDLAAAIGDGFVSTQPDADAVRRFRDAAGPGKLTVAGAKGCFAATTDEALKIAHRLWPTEGLPGELAQVLPDPEHFAQAAELVTPDMIEMAHGPDPDPYLKMIDGYRTAGYDSLHVAAVGPHYRELIDLFARDIVPNMA